MNTDKKSPKQQDEPANEADEQVRQLQQQLAELTEALQRERADADRGSGGKSTTRMVRRLRGAVGCANRSARPSDRSGPLQP